MISLASTQKLYEKISRKELFAFTVPAFNIRLLTFDTARTLFRAAQKEKAGAFIIELARSEMAYTAQGLEEYRQAVLSAAEKENFQGPVFLQGDHYKIEADSHNLDELRALIKEAVGFGFYNIDLDGSKLPIKENFQKTARLTAFIRSIQGEAKEISVGGEVGVIGGRNTTLDEFKEFIQGYNQELKKNWGTGAKGIIKIAIQTGTSHGGLILPSGKLKIPDEDFQTLKRISSEAKKYGLAGAVQHGASTLPDEYFKKFPETGCCEIHLATIFQNIVFDSEYFPADLREKIYFWLEENHGNRKKPGENQVQFIYRNRKYALGPFKREIENIARERKDKICAELEEKFRFFFKALNVSNTQDLIKEIYD